MTDKLLYIAGALVTVAGAVAAIQKWVVLPLKHWMEKTMVEKLGAVEKSLGTVQDDVSDLLGDRLSEAYHQAMRDGCCSHEDKKRYVSLHKRYTARGHNHLAAQYEQDLLALPEEKP